MAPHSSTLAWKIPWMEEPGRLQSMVSLSAGHDWVTSLSLFTFMHWRRKWQPTPVFLPGESQGQRSLLGCRLWGSHRVGHDWLPTLVFLGIPGGSAGKAHLQCGRSGFDPWVGKIPWRKEQLHTPVFWPGEFHGLHSSWGCRVGHDGVTFTFTFSLEWGLRIRWHWCHWLENYVWEPCPTGASKSRVK